MSPMSSDNTPPVTCAPNCVFSEGIGKKVMERHFVVDVQEIKVHLVNVKNSLNFLNKIGVPVSSHNDTIARIMELLKDGDIPKAKEEVLSLRKETSGILSRMDNIHNGLLEIEKEIARLAKEKKGTIALRRLYGQCRLALRDKDYDQVQLFIIKMDKIIEMYRFLERSTVLADIDEGEEIEDAITKLELDEIKKRKALRDVKSILEPILVKRYTEPDEDIPILVPIYDDHEQIFPREKEDSEEQDNLKSESPVESPSKISDNEIDHGGPVESRMNSILMTIRDNRIRDEDIDNASEVLKILVKNEDWKGANEIADELEKLIDSFDHEKNMQTVSGLHRQAKTAIMNISEEGGPQSDIRIIYERGKKLMGKGELEKSQRLFRETISMCREREGIELREIRLDRINKLEERIRSIPREWLDTSPMDHPQTYLRMERKLKEVSSSVDRPGDVFDGLIRPLEDEIDGILASYWKEKLGSLDESLSEKIDGIRETEGYRYELHRILERAREQSAQNEWKKAELIYQCGMEEIKISHDMAAYEKELDIYEKGLAYLDGNSATYMRSEKHIGECRNRLLRRDLEGFLEAFDSLKEVSQDDIIRNRSHSNLKLLNTRILELPEGDFRDSMQKRYLEAKSKIDDRKYYECLELSKGILNEITILALEEIRRS